MSKSGSGGFAMEKTILCACCRKEIDASLKKCPHCHVPTETSKNAYDYIESCKSKKRTPSPLRVSSLINSNTLFARKLIAAYEQINMLKNIKKTDTYISRIKVVNLFNDLNYEIDFKKEISIILGPNGFGKTTIFGFINFLLNPSSDIYIKHVQGVPFDSFEIELNGSIKVTLTKKKDDSYAYEIVNSKGGYHTDAVFPSIKEKDLRDEYISERRGLSSRYRKKIDSAIRDMKKALSESNLRVDVFFIKTNRAFENLDDKKKDAITEIDSPFDYYPLRYEMYRDNVINVTTPIKACNDDLVKLIKDCKNKYQKLIEDVKNSLPRKFIGMSNKIMPPEEIRKKWEQYRDKVKELNSFGLLEVKEDFDYFGSLPEDAYQDTGNGKAAFLSLYITEYEKTLKPFDVLYNKMVVFRDIINQRNCHNFKRIEYTSNGIGYFNKDQEIGLESLSSGEKNDFIMFFDMIFRTEKGTIVLIDEPEISLHIFWQEKFIDNVVKALDNKDCQVVIATHSPNIIGNHAGYVVTTSGDEELPEEEYDSFTDD